MNHDILSYKIALQVVKVITTILLPGVKGHQIG